MRVIEFRGISLKRGCWAYGNLIVNTDAYLEVKQTFINNSISGVQYKNQYPLADLIVVDEVDINTIGQYTGFNDNNQKGIYEGDVVKDSNGFMWEVVFEDGKWLLSSVDFAGTKVIGGCEVIGNIHEGVERDKCNCSNKECEVCILAKQLVQ